MSFIGTLCIFLNLIAYIALIQQINTKIECFQQGNDKLGNIL